MNWRREDQNFTDAPWRDFFAPESVLTSDGRRVMWAWLDSLSKELNVRTLQSLPRELSLAQDGTLRIKPIRELELQRHDQKTQSNVKVDLPGVRPFGGVASATVAKLEGDSLEIRVTVARSEAERKRFGFTVYSDGKAAGLPILIRPETGTLRVGTTEAPFAVADLPAGEDLELRIFLDKYLVEVFANDRQALVAAYAGPRENTLLTANTFGASTTLKQVDVWQLKPTNQGFRQAQQSQAWRPDEN